MTEMHQVKYGMKVTILTFRTTNKQLKTVTGILGLGKN
jgi:hypothetical protein